ncbi:aldo/keto reductase [Actinoplanes sp. NPDC026623]|uniref:aldo/keto reductase n=1 Tax=Actinoplanes sp. NPDC026623 TaxID=3155610 RepID=UPI0033E4B47C
MQTRNFGRLGRISALTLGGGGIGGVWGGPDRAEAIATVHAALDAGITMIDAAPSCTPTCARGTRRRPTRRTTSAGRTTGARWPPSSGGCATRAWSGHGASPPSDTRRPCSTRCATPRAPTPPR